MPEDLDLLAAELALGLLDGSDRLDALQLELTDPEFAAAVTNWQAIAEAWVTQLPDHSPSPQMLERVVSLLAPASAEGIRAADEPVVPVAASQSWASPIWRPLAIAASLIACLFAGLWLLQFHGASSPRDGSIAANLVGRFSVAQIGGTDDPHLATMLYDRHNETLTIRIAAISSDPAKAPEIWLINGTKPPRSLGFGQAGATTRMRASPRLQNSLVGGATLAITLEPISVQPHAAPTSKILGTGTISTL